MGDIFGFTKVPLVKAIPHKERLATLCGIAVCFRPVRLSGTLLRAALTAAGENKAEF